MRRSLTLALTVFSLVAVGGPHAAATVSDEAGPGCRFVEVPVPTRVVEEQLVPAPGAGTVASGGASEFTISGRLCLPAGKKPATVMLAMHGITYTNSYWNVDLEPERYNFSRYMTRAGYAVFSIDRLGHGKSSKPPSQLVTLDAHAEVANELIGKLRAGEVGGTKFSRVILVGYSYGSATSFRTTSKYNAADTVIATAWGSTFQNRALARVFSTFTPAQLDPRFADRPIGDLTLGPDGREQNFFYDLSNVDPRILQYAKTELADTLSMGEAMSFYPRMGSIPLAYLPQDSREIEVPQSDQLSRITVPTFLVNGTFELFFCGADQQHCTSSQQLQQVESKYYSAAACFRAAVIPNAGHNLNLQRNARLSFATIRTFADQALGPDGRNAATYRARCAAFSGANVDPGPAKFGAVGG